MLDNKLPYSEEAEISVLGSMLLDNTCIDDVICAINTDSFYKEPHKVIFQSIVDIHAKNSAVDLIILKNELNSKQMLDRVGGIPFLMSLEESVPYTGNIDYYLGIISEKSIKRKLIIAAQDIQNDAKTGNTSVADLIDRTEKKIFDITQSRTSNQTKDTKTLVSETLDHIDMLHDKDARDKGDILTGFVDLDDMTSGLHKNDLIILAARPSMGKTSFALNILRNVAIFQNKPSAMFSLEMDNRQIMQNLLCCHSDISSFRVRKGSLSSDELSKLAFSASAIADIKLFIDDTPGMTVLQLRSKARKLKMQEDIQFIIIDYLQLLCGDGKENRQQEVSFMSRYLKILARELEIPIMVLSQLNRSAEAREGHKPRMSDLRESGAIEQDADVVLLLHRDEYYDNTNNPGVAEINIAKQRMGPTGTIKLVFMQDYMRFENLGNDYE